MALPTITIDDFTGWAKIALNEFKQVSLEEYIATFQEEYLRKIVGDWAYYLIASENLQKWVDLIQGVSYSADGKTIYMPGLKKSLVYFIYFEYTRDNFTSRVTGKAKGKSELSERATDIEVGQIAVSRYNKAVRLINNSLPDFLDYYEKVTTTITNSNSSGGGNYNLTVDTNTYLYAGDTVTIEGIEYGVISVSGSGNIVIDGGATGLDFTGLQAYWKPFESVNFELLRFCTI